MSSNLVFGEISRSLRSGAASDIDRLGFVGAIVKAFIKGDLPGEEFRCGKGSLVTLRCACVDSKPLREKFMMLKTALAFFKRLRFGWFWFLT